MGNRSGRTWPLLLIAAPAAVAIWSGWVGLGGLCGFGPVRLLPGITGWTLNTAITLPIGVEAYAAFALGAWMSPRSPGKARTFARWSALGALAYGMAGQIIYHLLAAAHATAAPWPVVVVVSCMPVAVLGFAAALTHMLRAPQEDEPERVRVTEGRPPSAWLDDQILGLLPRMSVRSTAEALGVSKTRVETAKRRAALAAAERGANYRAASGRGGVVTPSVATPTAPAAQDTPAGERPPSLAGASPNGRA